MGQPGQHDRAKSQCFICDHSLKEKYAAKYRAKYGKEPPPIEEESADYHAFQEALAAAEKIASFSAPVAMMVKEAVNRAYETTLAEGVLFERRSFHAAFALADQKEGMAAFVAKRKPAFRHR